MKLYVWEGAFTDYTSGIAVALANTADEAREAIVKEYNDVNEKYVREELAVRPDVYRMDRKKPVAFTVSGGG